MKERWKKFEDEEKKTTTKFEYNPKIKMLEVTFHTDKVNL
jgi:hypothetical protein